MFEEKTINALKWIVDILDRKKVLYQLTGGFAAKVYGSVRSVNDIDVDIPEDKFKEIFDEVKPYIISGPKQINDGKWDMKILTLNYQGQEIDIGGAYDAKISNKDRTEWIKSPVDYSKTRKMNVEGVDICIISPEELIKYKQHLDGAHQIEDINAVKKYLENERRN